MHVTVQEFGSDDAVVLLEAMHAGHGTFEALHRAADQHGADFTIALTADLMLRGVRMAAKRG